MAELSGYAVLLIVLMAVITSVCLTMIACRAGSAAAPPKAVHPSVANHHPRYIPRVPKVDDLTSLLDIPGEKYVYFYSPTCGHCVAFNSIVDRAYLRVQDAPVVAVDVNQLRDLPIGIPHVPYLVRVNTVGTKQTVDEYRGPRTMEAVAVFLSRPDPAAAASS